VTANLGADLAKRGRRVLLMISTAGQPHVSRSTRRTSGTPSCGGADDAALVRLVQLVALGQALQDLVTTPPRVNAQLGRHGGRLDLIASDLGLVDVELDLAAGLGVPGIRPSAPTM